MFSLQNGPDLVQGTLDLVAHATAIYKDVFGSQQMSHARMRDNIWSEAESLTEEDRVEMDKPVTEEEIKNVVDQMEKNKAAGPDGFPIEFYQACWDIIKQDLMMIFSDFHQNKIDLARINYGVITLLPEGADANTIQKYRPICLLQVLFKIVTKALTVRSEMYIRKIIHTCQTAFIKGRFITDGVMLLQEILRDTKYRKQQGVVLKLDFEKAYDKVNWNFLLDCCRQKGFSEKWLTWINKAVSGGTLSVKVNDYIGPYFYSYKGVRQGDPFAPILFNLVVNCLSKMIQTAQ
jgi:mannosylglycoprotein endo-beta-mannosidase